MAPSTDFTRPRLCWLVALALGLSLLAPAQESLLRTDFAPAEGYRDLPAASGQLRLAGALPGAWTVAPGASGKLAASRQTELPPAVVDSFLRLVAADTGAAPLRLSHPVAAPAAGSLLRLQLRARAENGLRVRLAAGPAAQPAWSATLALPPQWEDLEYVFALPAAAGQTLALELLEAGTLDLRRLAIDRFSEAEWQAKQRSDADNLRVVNLMRNSRFPLGLPSGWSLDPRLDDGSEVRVSVDAGMTGADGVPSLKLESPLPRVLALLRSEPLDLVSTYEPHVASLFVRGGGRLILTVMHADKSLASKSLDLTPGQDWQRLEVPFAPRQNGRYHHLALRFAGTLWIDCLQVERGKTASAYRPRQSCEIALLCTPGAAAPAPIRFADEAPTFAYAVTGAPPGAVIRFRAVNAYGDSRPLLARALGPELMNFGTQSFDVFPGRPFGPCRIEAWLELDGRPISPVNEIVVCRLPRPRYWEQDAPQSPFGLHCAPLERHLALAKAIGANWVRLHDVASDYLAWDRAEPIPTHFSFADNVLQRYRRRQLLLLGELGTAPAWASYYSGSKREAANQFEYADRYFQPRNPADFAAFAAKMVQHYRGTIDAWSIWSQPWSPSSWAVAWDPAAPGADPLGYLTSAQPARDYVRLMEAGYTAAKKAAPACRIVAGATTGEAQTGPAWSAELTRAGAAKFLDAIDFQQSADGLTAFPGDAIEQGCKAALAPFQAGAKPAPSVIVTQGRAAATLLGTGMYRYTTPGLPAEPVLETSNRLSRYLVSLLAQRVERVFLYSLHPCSTFLPNTEPAACQLVTPDGALHPSAAAYAQLAWLLEDCRPVQVLPLAEGVNAYVFQTRPEAKAARAVAVLSTAPSYAAYALPQVEGLGYSDLFGNPLPAGTALGRNLVYAAVQGDAALLLKSLPAKK